MGLVFGREAFVNGTDRIKGTSKFALSHAHFERVIWVIDGW
jgi:hypothetical protein